jgi:hypothetical protein
MTAVIAAAAATAATPPKKIIEPDSLHAKPHECRVSRELGEKKELRSLP